MHLLLLLADISPAKGKLPAITAVLLLLLLFSFSAVYLHSTSSVIVYCVVGFAFSCFLLCLVCVLWLKGPHV